MPSLFSFFKKYQFFLIVISILLIGIFFRSFQIIERFDFGHDGDLYSWIVKDIVVDRHVRLLGQLTSAPGIFIGPFFYYLLIPFFLITQMDPIGVSILGILFGIFTILSYLFVLSKLFNKTVGIVGAFLHSILLSEINFDRWIVPTLPTKLWAIWYLYCILMISRGNFSVLPILAILIGLIWHIHIALAPTLIAVPVALYLSKKLPTKKDLAIFALLLLVTSLPFILFEVRHNFSQAKSLIRNFTSIFGSEDTITEEKEIVLGKQTDYSSLNFNPSTKFTLEVQPTTPNINSNVILKISTKNPKYSTMIIRVDCGPSREFEIGSVSGEFNWSTMGCNEGPHKLIASARIPTDPAWKTIFNKFTIVLEKQHRNIQDMFISPLNLPVFLKYLLTGVILLSPAMGWWIYTKRQKEVLVIYSWMLSVFLFFTFSSIILSEYYLASINILFLVSLSIIFAGIYKNKGLGKYLILILAVILLLKNLYYFVNQQDYKKGYLEKKSALEYIVSDAKQQGFPCISIGYISSIGENVGFRYFTWLFKLKTVKSEDAPTYNIVIPSELASKEVSKKFGNIGIINPTKIPSKESLEKICTAPDANLNESMFGYVE